MNYDEIQSLLDVQDALYVLRETHLLLQAADQWITLQHLDCSEETKKAISEVGFFLREYLDKEPDKVIERCMTVIDDSRRNTRLNGKNS